MRWLVELLLLPPLLVLLLVLLVPSLFEDGVEGGSGTSMSWRLIHAPSARSSTNTYPHTHRTPHTNMDTSMSTSNQRCPIKA
jgi:hypothetical protein